MIYLPVTLLESGMVLAKSVPSYNPMVPWLVAGRTLTPSMLLALSARGIKGLYVEYELSDDITPSEVLDSEEKQVLLSDIKTQFDLSNRTGAKMNYKAINKASESIVMSVLNNDRLLHNVMDIRDYDSYTYSHSLYVGMIAVILGVALKLPATKLSQLATAGLLHDIGKLEISPAIINKPDKLTDAELETMRQHPTYGVDRLRYTTFSQIIVQGVACHHERVDGAGYPRGLSGAGIPQFGRILAIADVYDALSSRRVYREAWSPSKVIDYITGLAGTHFDAQLVSYFLSTIEAYPVGTLVKLSDGSIGIVIRNNPGMTLRPVLRLIAPPQRLNTQLDLSAGSLHITILDSVSRPEDIALLHTK